MNLKRVMTGLTLLFLLGSAVAIASETDLSVSENTETDWDLIFELIEAEKMGIGRIHRSIYGDL